MAGAQRTGLWFEDFAHGWQVESAGRTVTEADVVNFCGISGDWTALHSDEEQARRTPFRGRIAHGMLVQAIATGLGTRTGVFEGTLQALSDMTIHWRAPVRIGDTLRLVLAVQSIDPDPSRRSGAVVFLARVLNQKEDVVSEGEWWTRILRRPAGERVGRPAAGERV